MLFDAEAVYDIDTTAAMGLLELIDELEALGVRFTIARLKAESHDFLVRAGVIERIGADAVFLQVADGAAAFLGRGDATTSAPATAQDPSEGQGPGSVDRYHHDEFGHDEPRHREQP